MIGSELSGLFSGLAGVEGFVVGTWFACVVSVNACCSAGDDWRLPGVRLVKI
jgi:hypothetical protein